MKLAIPVDENNMETTVCPSFGRAPYFLLYDTETKTQEFMENSAAASAGGAGIKAAQIVVDCKVQGVLTPRCGQNAAEVLKAEGIKLYKTVDTSLAANLALFAEGKLGEVTETHPGFHQHG